MTTIRAEQEGMVISVLQHNLKMVSNLDNFSSYNEKKKVMSLIVTKSVLYCLFRSNKVFQCSNKDLMIGIFSKTIFICFVVDMHDRLQQYLVLKNQIKAIMLFKKARMIATMIVVNCNNLVLASSMLSNILSNYLQIILRNLQQDLRIITQLFLFKIL